MLRVKREYWPVFSLIWCLKRSPAATCLTPKSRTIHWLMVPFPEPGAPVIMNLNDVRMHMLCGSKQKHLLTKDYRRLASTGLWTCCWFLSQVIFSSAGSRFRSLPGWSSHTDLRTKFDSNDMSSDFSQIKTERKHLTEIVFIYIKLF